MKFFNGEIIMFVEKLRIKKPLRFSKGSQKAYKAIERGCCMLEVCKQKESGIKAFEKTRARAAMRLNELKVPIFFKGP